MFEEDWLFFARKQTFDKLKNMRLVMFEDALGSKSKALDLEKRLQKYYEQRGLELMGKKGGKKGNKGGKQKDQNKQKQQAQEKKGKKNK